MDRRRRRLWNAFAILALLAAVAVLAVDAGLVSAPWTQDREDATVTVRDGNGTVIATVAVEVADTRTERVDGLSGRENLEWGRGMLFVHPSDARQTYVMRNMEFPLDVIFVGPDGRVRKVAHLPAPGPGEDGESIRVSGRAKYVLEVPRGYANATGISEGDRIDIEYAGNGTTAGE